MAGGQWQPGHAALGHQGEYRKGGCNSVIHGDSAAASAQQPPPVHPQHPAPPCARIQGPHPPTAAAPTSSRRGGPAPHRWWVLAQRCNGPSETGPMFQQWPRPSLFPSGMGSRGASHPRPVACRLPGGAAPRRPAPAAARRQGRLRPRLVPAALAVLPRPAQRQSKLGQQQIQRTEGCHVAQEAHKWCASQSSHWLPLPSPCALSVLAPRAGPPVLLQALQHGPPPPRCRWAGGRQEARQTWVAGEVPAGCLCASVHPPLPHRPRPRAAAPSAAGHRWTWVGGLACGVQGL